MTNCIKKSEENAAFSVKVNVIAEHMHMIYSLICNIYTQFFISFYSYNYTFTLYISVSHPLHCTYTRYASICAVLKLHFKDKQNSDICFNNRKTIIVKNKISKLIKLSDIL